MARSTITGTGLALPPYELDNDALMPIIERLHPEARPRKWCEQIFGVYRRRRSLDYATGLLRQGCRDGELALQASTEALAAAGVTAADIDYIIYTTGSPEHVVDPDPVVELHRALDAPGACGGITVPITCTGLVDAVVLGDALVRAGSARHVLLVGSAVASSYPSQSWEFLFNAGDAAAALVLSAAESEDQGGILDTFVQILPGDPATRIRHCGTAQFHEREPAPGSALDLEMDLDQIALQGLPVVEALLALVEGRHRGLMARLDWLVCHQASELLQHHLALATGLRLEQIPFHVRDLGNTMTASTGVALHTLRTGSSLKRGDLVLVMAVGTSWRTAAYLMRW
jgi:3-oxoacyl-[acyl-carrier-protein] synthase III